MIYIHIPADARHCPQERNSALKAKFSGGRDSRIQGMTTPFSFIVHGTVYSLASFEWRRQYTHSSSRSFANRFSSSYQILVKLYSFRIISSFLPPSTDRSPSLPTALDYLLSSIDSTSNPSPTANGRLNSPQTTCRPFFPALSDLCFIPSISSIFHQAQTDLIELKHSITSNNLQSR